MFIYPGNHKIISTENVNLNTDIPLAYINMNSSDYNVDIISYLKSNENNKVIPYSTFDTTDMLFFDKDGNSFSASKYLKREGTNYIYDPELVPGTNTFVPLNYSYYVVGKRETTYKINKQYDLNISCIDSLPDLPLSKKLIPLFGDAPDRGICPHNIIVNKKDKTMQTLSNSTIMSNDFIFVDSSNGTQYSEYWKPSTDKNVIQYIQGQTVYYNNIRYNCVVTHNAATAWGLDQLDPNNSQIHYWEQVDDTYKSEMDASIDINSFLSYNTNVWISSHDVAACPKVLQTTTSTVKNPVCLKNTSTFNYYFDSTNIYLGDDSDIHNIFTESEIPVLIIEYKNKGFVIITPKEFFENINDHIDLFYEVLMYVYCKSYVRSQTYTDWITDKAPDYIAVNNNLIKKDKFLSKTEPYNMFGLEKDEFNLIDVVIGNNYPFVVCNGLVNDFLWFTKLSTGMYSIYADKYNDSGTTIYVNNRIVVIKDFIYTIENNINDHLQWTIVNNKIYFNIDRFKSSINNIDSNPTELTYKLIYDSTVSTFIDLYLCYSNNDFYLIPIKNYNQSLGTKIARIQISKVYDESTIYDMRQRGGGLPINHDDNYDLLDIGNINGKSYRKGGVLVITLPARLEQYNDLILAAVKKHMIGEDFPVILYK